MDLDRRLLVHSLAGAAALAPFLALERAMAQTRDGPSQAALDTAAQAHTSLMNVPGLNMHGEETVVMLLYPGFTALDLVGPHYFFAGMMGARVQLVTNQPNLEPVKSDLGLAIQPTDTFATAVEAPTILFSPGGSMGTSDAMRDARTVEFVRSRGRGARYVTSVCTGALVLAAAGLLRGRRATTHWVAREVLADFGATAVDARVVTDGNVVTGAGVSAGLDFGLAVVEKLRGRPYAQALMLQAEYAPEPPFAGGTYAATDPAVAKPLKDMFAPIIEQMRATARATKS